MTPNPSGYQKISNSQILLHPNPKGIIQFVGSFIYGSFPAWSYKYLHQFLFNLGYSLILYRFPLNPFQFNHWQVAFELFKEQQELRKKIPELIQQNIQYKGFVDSYSNSANFFWLGHSLGCKYIILLEILSNKNAKRRPILSQCISQRRIDETFNQLEQQELITSHFIQNQPSIFLAPEISNTVRLLRSNLRISNLFTQPTQGDTECLIRESIDLFNLTGLISFTCDSIAEDDVAFLVEQIRIRSLITNQPLPYRELGGWHFEPLGIHIEMLGSCIDHLFDDLKRRK
jgi:hypothetical protein